MTERRFSVLGHMDKKLAALGYPATVAWALIEPLRKSCYHGHGQTLERLNERGGLSPGEMFNHVHAVPFRDWGKNSDTHEHVVAWFCGWAAE